MYMYMQAACKLLLVSNFNNIHYTNESYHFNSSCIQAKMFVVLSRYPLSTEDISIPT